ncbi:MAG: hypothetical protein KC425_09355 [Anaerolineales bacterium]|nr:hypothetical protein [Anaerolineales bacterium]
MHGLEQTYGDQIAFEYLDVDNPDTADARIQYGFRYQPHFILLDADGRVVQEWLGYQSANVFEEAFADLLTD